MARPSDYSDDLAAEICGRLATGEPLVRICRDEAFPHVSTIYRWILANDAFRDMYTRAREDQADTLADQIIDIADDSTNDYMETADGVLLNSENIQRSRLRVDARKFIAAKLKPKKYGELVKHEHGGENGAPIPMSIMVSYAKPSSG